MSHSRSSLAVLLSLALFGCSAATGGDESSGSIGGHLDEDVACAPDRGVRPDDISFLPSDDELSALMGLHNDAAARLVALLQSYFGARNTNAITHYLSDGALTWSRTPVLHGFEYEIALAGDSGRQSLIRCAHSVEAAPAAARCEVTIGTIAGGYYQGRPETSTFLPADGRGTCLGSDQTRAIVIPTEGFGMRPNEALNFALRQLATAGQVEPEESWLYCDASQCVVVIQDLIEQHVEAGGADGRIGGFMAFDGMPMANLSIGDIEGTDADRNLSGAITTAVIAEYAAKVGETIQLERYDGEVELDDRPGWFILRLHGDANPYPEGTFGERMVQCVKYQMSPTAIPYSGCTFWLPATEYRYGEPGTDNFLTFGGPLGEVLASILGDDLAELGMTCDGEGAVASCTLHQ